MASDFAITQAGEFGIQLDVEALWSAVKPGEEEFRPVPALNALFEP